MHNTETPTRRPITSRSNPLVQLAAKLLAPHITPNQISLSSIGFALLASLFMFVPPTASPVLHFLAPLLFIQLRLLANVLDGIVAIEHHQQHPTGFIFNELPDRISDTLIFISFGYAIQIPVLGFYIAIFSLLTAYIRQLTPPTVPQPFHGPMAKPHRMFALCLILLISYLFPPSAEYVQIIGTVLILLGTGLTCIRRTLYLLNTLSPISPSQQ